MYDSRLIRNFAIVAHIDHGKSTLADRLLEATHTIDPRLMTEQVLDSNPIEKERGITIKLAPVRMTYKYNSKTYILNLIDTPGHVDFSYEVSRSLSACEGILLVIDAAQGIQAQTVAHMQLVRSKKLKVIPIINKIDLPTAKPEEVIQTLVESFKFHPWEIIKISAKEGINIDEVLAAIVNRIPQPSGIIESPLKALVFSSRYDSHKGVVVYIRIVEGKIDYLQMKQLVSQTKISILKFVASKTSFTPLEIGYFTPQMKTCDILSAGEVGYVATGLKDLKQARIGDTLTNVETTVTPLPGYKEPKPMVYLSLFPTDTLQFLELREALEKLHLSDCSFSYQLHSSPALGKGFLCGFLGLLHGEIIKERLEKEFNLNIIATAPSVEYRIHQTDEKELFLHTADDFPDPSRIKTIYEPIMYTTIYTPADYVGKVMQLCQDKRAEMVNLVYISTQAQFIYLIPLTEMIFDFFDDLKSITSGYASLEYEFYEYKPVDAVRLDILINKINVEAFSQIVVKEKSKAKANLLVEKLKSLIPRHQFQIPIQAAIGGNIIARADVKSFRKDVTKKLYGGDRTRKDKLLDKQKKGKKRLKQFGKVEIPQEVFLKLYK